MDHERSFASEAMYDGCSIDLFQRAVVSGAIVSFELSLAGMNSLKG